MQLDPGERAIFAYFSDYSDARVAADILKQSGYNEIRVDRIAPYSASRVNRRIKTSLSSLTMNNGRRPGLRSLLAADPAASGMSSTYYDQPGSSSIVLTLVCDDSLSSSYRAT